jgi:hypothetical protein
MTNDIGCSARLQKMTTQGFDFELTNQINTLLAMEDVLRRG